MINTQGQISTYIKSYCNRMLHVDYTMWITHPICTCHSYDSKYMNNTNSFYSSECYLIRLIAKTFIQFSIDVPVNNDYFYSLWLLWKVMSIWYTWDECIGYNECDDVVIFHFAFPNSRRQATIINCFSHVQKRPIFRQPQ